jgi:hypothetical protein
MTGLKKLRSRRLSLAVTIMAVVWLAGFGLIDRAKSQAGAATSQTKPKTAGETFKNVTSSTLKGLTVDDFMGAMGVMAAALGFDCSNCHPGAGYSDVNWQVDTMPTKVIARRMIEMVAVINGTNFAGASKVTCWTCHHGRQIPATSIALDHLYGDPNDEKDDVITRNPAAPPPDQILDKYIAALGGSQQLSSLTSFIATGTQNGGFQHVQGGGVFQIFAKAPDQRSVSITFPKAPDRGDQTRAYDGHVGWINAPRSVLGEYEVTGSELDGQRMEAELAFPGQIKQVLTNLRSGPADSINDNEVLTVQGEGPRGLLVTLYFDKQSGLLRRLIRYGKSPVGRISTQVDYDDYRAVDGIKFPFSFTFSWLDGKDGFQLTEVKTNVPIDQSVFGRPRRATTN